MRYHITTKNRVPWPLLFLWLWLVIPSRASYVLPTYIYISGANNTLAACSVVCSQQRPERFVATITSPLENSAACRVIPSGGRVMLGGNRLTGNQSVFRWVTGPLAQEDGGLGRPFYHGTLYTNGYCVPGAYCNFLSSQPDNYNGLGENQLEIAPSLNGCQWNDVTTKSTLQTGCLCQTPWRSSTTLSLSVSATASPGVEAWYIPNDASGSSFDFCLAACPASRPGGFLATPLNAQENAIVRAAVPMSVVGAFLGGTRRGDGIHYRWVAGPLRRMSSGMGPIFFNSSVYINGTCTPPFFCPFLLGEPNNYRNAEFFVTMSYKTPMWNDDSGAGGCACMRRFSPVALSRSSSSSLVRSATASTSSSVLMTRSLSLSATQTNRVSASLSLTAVTPRVTHSFALPETLSHSTTHSERTSSLPTRVGVAFLNSSIGTSLLVAGDVAADCAGSADCNQTTVDLFVMLIGVSFSPFLQHYNKTSSCFAGVTVAPQSLLIDAALRVALFVNRTTQIVAVSQRIGLVRLKTSAATYMDLTGPVSLVFHVRGDCLENPLVALADTLTIAPSTLNLAKSNTVLQTTQIVASVVSLINPVAAVQAYRNQLALSIQYCLASQDSLDFLHSPTQLSLGEENREVSAFVGAAIFNHCFMLALACLHGAVVSAHYLATSRQRGGGSAKAMLMSSMAAVRFPSLLVIPFLIFIEPTATSAVITLLYAESTPLVVAGYASLVVCVLYSVLHLTYILRSFGAEYVVARRAPGDEEAASNGCGRRVLDVVYGTGKWEDLPDAFGFCRRNRILFIEYRQGCYWFLHVELLLSAVLGGLEGIKLGYGNCTEVLYTVACVFFVYLTLFVALRPCASLLANASSVLLAASQLAGAVLLCLPYDAKRVDIAVLLAEVGSYILLAKSATDAAEAIHFAWCSIRRHLNMRDTVARYCAEERMSIDALTSLVVPHQLLVRPVNLLIRDVEVVAAHYALVSENSILCDMLLRPQAFLGSDALRTSAASIVEQNVGLMKVSAAMKASVDGVWRDWRLEESHIPLELVALSQQLQAAHSAMLKQSWSKPPPNSNCVVDLDDATPRDGGGDEADTNMALLEEMLKEDVEMDEVPLVYHDGNGLAMDTLTSALHTASAASQSTLAVTAFGTLTMNVDDDDDDMIFPDLRK